MRARVSTRGTSSPRSQRDTTDCLVWSTSASCCWVRPACVRARRMSAAT
jgi:hypothetical protein